MERAHGLPLLIAARHPVLTSPLAWSPSSPPLISELGGGTREKQHLLGNQLSCHAGYDVILDSVVARKILPAVMCGPGTKTRTECP